MRKPVQFAGLVALALALTMPLLAKGEGPVVWRKVPMALLRVDDEAPKTWQVYRAEKRKQSLLVQIGARFLVLDIEARRVYELAERTMTRKDDSSVEWNDAPEPAPNAAADPAGPAKKKGEPARLELPSEDWTMRDVGPMMRIRLRLSTEGREFDIQIPIQPDLRQFY